jgi:hypothetical protein
MTFTLTDMNQGFAGVMAIFAPRPENSMARRLLGAGLE